MTMCGHCGHYGEARSATHERHGSALGVRYFGYCEEAWFGFEALGTKVPTFQSQLNFIKINSLQIYFDASS